ncbi:MAG: guanylate kinase [Coriobacteriales bacterium]|nr:guanylate kinase [Coriobacteriales bacterium]
MANRLFVISGPSGAGKGTLVKGLMSVREDLWLSVSATTRQPRPGEIDGETYFFLSREEFDRCIEEGDFLEWADVHGNRYGTLRSAVEERLEAGLSVILEIDVQGALIVQRSYPEAVLIFVKPPSFEELRRRLIGRGTESEEQVELRMANAKVEMELEGCYNYSVTNDEVDIAVSELNSIIDFEIG